MAAPTDKSIEDAIASIIVPYLESDLGSAANALKVELNQGKAVVQLRLGFAAVRRITRPPFQKLSSRTCREAGEQD